MTEADQALCGQPYNPCTVDHEVGTFPAFKVCAACREVDAARLCDTCQTAPAPRTRTEGGSTPVYRLCSDCARAFDEAVR
jgi:hypothetical protein